MLASAFCGVVCQATWPHLGATTPLPIPGSVQGAVPVLVSSHVMAAFTSGTEVRPW